MALLAFPISESLEDGSRFTTNVSELVLPWTARITANSKLILTLRWFKKVVEGCEKLRISFEKTSEANERTLALLYKCLETLAFVKKGLTEGFTVVAAKDDGEEAAPQVFGKMPKAEFMEIDTKMVFDEMSVMGNEEIRAEKDDGLKPVIELVEKMHEPEEIPRGEFENNSKSMRNLAGMLTSVSEGTEVAQNSSWR